MSTPSAKIGAVSGCLLWVLAVGVLVTCLIPVALIVSVFTATSDAAAQTIGPLVCPEGTIATIERSNTAYRTDLGTELPATTREMVCVDSHSAVVTRPSPLTNWLWTGFISVVLLLITGLLSFALAVPAGALIGTLTRQIQRKRNKQ